jgi:TRAP-type uncharacterized transport system substrate-binding protein
VDAPVATVSMMNWVVALETLDADVVRAILNVLRDDRVSLERVHEMARSIDLATLDAAPIPLHPATEAWRVGR